VLDRGHDLELLQAQVPRLGGPVSWANGTEDVGDLERGAHRLARRVHFLRPCTPLPQANAYAMIGRRAAAAGIAAKLGNHSFRATGITA
jgi:hypothetical protein